MDNPTLLAVTPIDGRYYGKTASLSEYFSEYALIRDRVSIEVEYFIALCRIPLPQLEGVLSPEKEEQLQSIWKDLTPEQAQKVKDI